MAKGVLMPKAGITVEECVITEWLKKEGDHVEVGDILFTYETDKASFECESTAAGTLLKIFYGDGEEVPVLVNVCAIGEPGEDVSALQDGGEAAPAAEATETAAAAAPASAPAPAPAAPTGPMAKGVLMPKAGITVEECVITEWVKKVGDQVKVGDVLFTYETDKASFECESTEEGTLLEIFYNDGDEVPVLVNVCAIGNPGDSTVGLRAGEEAPAAATAAPSAPAPAQASAAAAGAQAATGKANPDAFVSPRARMTAATLGVDPTMATPTGPHGRIVEADVRALAASLPLTGASAAAAAPATAAAGAAAGAKAQAPAAAAATAPTGGEAEYVDVKFSSVRKATAKAMTKSLSTMAQLTMKSCFDASALMAMRKKIKANAEKMGLPNITLNDMVMFAVSRVILNHSDLNAIMPEYQDRVSFIALDVTNDSVKDMQFYAEKRGFTIPMAKDPGVRKAVKANEHGYPYTVVVGKNATVLYNPFETDEAQLDGLRRMLDDMLSLTDEQYEHLAETDLDWYNTQVPYNSDEQKQIYLDYGHNFYIYNIRDNMNLTVSGEGVVPVVIDEGLELLKKTEMVGQFYLVKNSSHMVTATIETTEPFLANKANTEYYDPEKEDYVIKYFSKAKKGKNTYVFEIPVGTGVTWFDEKSSADRNRYSCVGFYTFMNKADIASYFREIERRHGYTVKWHLGE